MSPSFGIEAIVGLMLINLHLQKLGGKSQLCTCKLPPSHLIWSLIDLQLNSNLGLDVVALDSLTNRQQFLVKSHLVDSANRVNECFPSFNPLNSEFSPGLRVINNFLDCISFSLFNKEKDNKSCIQLLDEMVLESSSSLFVTIIASNASIKNNVAMSIAHIHTYDKPLIKTIHHAVNVTSMEAELFVIRCGINQATHINNISKIIVVTDSIHAVKRIFNPSVYPFQVQSAAVLYNLHYFFNCHTNNSIKFWECPSYLKWHLHNKVNKETKMFKLLPLYPCKNLWNFSKKCKSNNILNVWKIMFQASDLKENQFLDLVDNNNNIIKLTYIKGGSWLKMFGYSNSLYACAIRVITNHAPIGKFRLRFFPRKQFKCPYD